MKNSFRIYVGSMTHSAGTAAASHCCTQSRSVHTRMAGHQEILLNSCRQLGITASSQVDVICRTPSTQATGYKRAAGAILALQHPVLLDL
jgi:hypothetical protein